MRITPIGFGAFKIGRNEGVKYPRGYLLPSDEQSDRLLRAVVDDLGINYIDTAPAYGVSEERIGRVLAARGDVVISTKVGERFQDGLSRFDFSDAAVRGSISRSREQLRRSALDLVFVHSNGEDERILRETDVVPTLQDLKRRGDVRYIGFSGKTLEGAVAALAWADALMLEYHLDDRTHETVITQAAASGVGVVVKKALASGRLPPSEAIRFVLANPGVTTAVVGGLNLDHLRDNVAVSWGLARQA